MILLLSGRIGQICGCTSLVFANLRSEIRAVGPTAPVLCTWYACRPACTGQTLPPGHVNFRSLVCGVSTRAWGCAFAACPAVCPSAAPARPSVPAFCPRPHLSQPHPALHHMALRLALLLCLLPPTLVRAAELSPSDFTVEHNKRRCLHGARDVVWDASLARSAQKAAGTCKFKHTSTPYGENLWAGQWVPDGDDCLDGWYDNEVGLYDWNSPGFSQATGHFSQVVWANTREIGCGLCDGGGADYAYIVACHYNPGGNVGGQHQSQVGRVTKTAAQCRADCGPPSQTGYDFSACSNAFPGRCDVKCRRGYWAKAAIYALCKSDGSWWYEGTCNANRCEQPKHPDPNVNMSSCMSGDGLIYEGTCAPTCKTGYVGNPTAVCQPEAVWKYGGSCVDPNTISCTNGTDGSNNCTTTSRGSASGTSALYLLLPVWLAVCVGVLPALGFE